jgi:hypothetical protein
MLGGITAIKRHDADVSEREDYIAQSYNLLIYSVSWRPIYSPMIACRSCNFWRISDTSCNLTRTALSRDSDTDCVLWWLLLWPKYLCHFYREWYSKAGIYWPLVCTIWLFGVCLVHLANCGWNTFQTILFKEFKPNKYIHKVIKYIFIMLHFIIGL